VAGTVLSASTGEPLDGVQVSLEGVPPGRKGLGGLTQPSGRYLILNVPVGEYLLRAQLIGFGTQTRTIVVEAGQTTNMDLRLEAEAIALSEIVVTGVVGATQRTKLPFEVAQVRTADLPIPEANPLQSLQGRVAGAQVVQGSGLPGSTPSVLLRGVTALDATGRSQDPLYIVDGVILGAEMVDMDALDIQSIEVVKGAAAASLFGSRAGNGVIHIRTRRGAEMPDDQIRYTFSSEFGGSGLVKDPAGLARKYHPYKLVGDSFEDANGNLCSWQDCDTEPVFAGQAAGGDPPSIWNSYQSNPWPGETYDQVARFFSEGKFTQNHVSVEGRSGRANFLVSGGNFRQEGILPYLERYRRINARANLDFHTSRGLSVSANTFFASSTGPGMPEESQQKVFEMFYRAPPIVDLLAKDPSNPDQPVFKTGVGDYDINPLYMLANDHRTERRRRLVGSSTVRYQREDWLIVEGNLSYDRSDVGKERVVPIGYRTAIAGLRQELGSLSAYDDGRTELNGSVTATGHWSASERIHNSTQIRYLFENWDRRWQSVEGTGFSVDGIYTLDNLDQDYLNAHSGKEQIRADGYFLISDFDILDRYVLDALVRNDGSSLFGEAQRRQWYYRMGGAWRLSQEGFFRIPGVNELKLRYSVGTAGGRPSFEAQYESYSVSGGQIAPVNLGNKELKPEHSTEHEMGLDLDALDHRLFFTLTYAQTTTRDQILQVPQPIYLGWRSQWQNAGTVKSHTWEAALDLRLLNRQDISWSAKVLFDATRSRITAMNVPDFRYGASGIGSGRPFYARVGEEIGTVYGSQAATSCAHLPEGVSCDGFEIDEYGFLVYTGPAGFSDPQWGTDVAVDGLGTIMWGTPFAGYCVDRKTGAQTTFCPIGNSLPDYNLSLSTSLTWKGISVYALLTHSAGFDVYNNSMVWSTWGLRDQGDIPVEDQKPYGYFNFNSELASGQPGSTFLEDGTFTKLREVSVAYELGPELLGRLPFLASVDAFRIRLTGRNLLLWTDYRGPDPEVGRSGGNTGSAAVDRVDEFAYPNFRTFTGAIEIVF